MLQNGAQVRLQDGHGILRASLDERCALVLLQENAVIHVFRFTVEVASVADALAVREAEHVMADDDAIVVPQAHGLIDQHAVVECLRAAQQRLAGQTVVRNDALSAIVELQRGVAFSDRDRRWLVAVGAAKADKQRLAPIDG